MALPTIQLTVNVQDQTGQPVAGAVVYAQLNQPDLYNGQYVEPVLTRVVADGTGNAVLTLFPNAIGTGPNGPTYYNLRAFNADESKRIFATTAYLPNADVNLSAVFGTLPAPSPPDLPMTPNVLPIVFGGTGASTQALALANLGLTGAAAFIAGQILFGGVPTGIAQDPSFFWNNTLKKAAIGTLVNVGGSNFTTMTADGQNQIYGPGTSIGIFIAGRGTSWDLMLANRSGQAVLQVTAGSKIVQLTDQVQFVGGTAGSAQLAPIQLQNNMLVSWRGGSGNFSDAGYIWYATSNSLNFGTNNTNQMQLGSTGVLSNPQEIHTPVIDSGLAASLSLRTNNGNEHLRVGHLGGTLVNFLKITGAPTGTAPALLAQGSDSNVSLTLGAQGANCSIILSATNVLVSGPVFGAANMLSPITASLGADVALNNTANYFDGPSIAQGTSGTWFVSGTVSLNSTGNDAMHAKLWDGTTVIASAFTTAGSAGAGAILCLSGFITSPAGNLRISVKDSSTTNGLIKFNTTGNNKDSTITAIRIG